MLRRPFFFKHESLAEAVRGFSILALHLLLLLFFCRTFVFQTLAVSSASMQDSLMVGDHVVVDMVRSRCGWNAIERIFLPTRPIIRGMIVVFHPPDSDERVFVKRVIGLPGDTIRMSAGRLNINGKPLRESYLACGIPQIAGNDDYACRVPPAHYFCLGDNRADSNDSRYWGFLPRRNIIGIPWRIYWSFRSTPETYACSGFAQHMQRFFDYVRGFLFRTRWKRTCRRVQLLTPKLQHGS
ncbi:MAG: signal peptidase I [Acidobacteriota bacterium]|jgi:signal peptidase I|nr:signal peptidase I [Acidobacteriota bacterium]